MMNNKPWFSTSAEAIRWMRDEARQWVDDKPEVAAHLFEAAMMFEKAELDARWYKARRKTIYDMRLRTEIPKSRNWKPTTLEEFCSEYDAACDKEAQRAALKDQT